MRIVIIGAGLAGTALAYTLRQTGLACDIYEAGPDIAPGSSGNMTGFVNPRLSAPRTPESDFYASAFALAVRTFDQIQREHDIGWHPCGTLHLIMEEKKRRRFPQTIRNWGWPEDHMRLLKPDGASERAGIPIEYDALYLPGSGLLSPRKLCRYYAAGTTVHFNTRIENLNEIQADYVILACGTGLQAFEETAWLPVKAVRGQITHIKTNEMIQKLKCNITFGGYCSPAIDGVHTLGATYQRWLDHDRIRPEDDQTNIEKLKHYVPSLNENFKIFGHRASVRCSAKDYFPIAGRLPGHKNIYITAAHGSHGIITTLAAAELITDMLTGRPPSQSKFTRRALAAQRFR